MSNNKERYNTMQFTIWTFEQPRYKFVTVPYSQDQRPISI